MEVAVNLDVEAARLMMNKGALAAKRSRTADKPFRMELRIPQQPGMSKAPISAGRGVSQPTRLSQT